MIDRLPNYYRKSKTVKDFYSVVQTILDKVSEEDCLKLRQIMKLRERE